MPLPKRNFKSRKGFTLIEILVVIAIIGVLAAIAAASYTQAQKKARDSKRKTDLKAIQQALDLYYQTNNTYPSTSIVFMRCNSGGDVHLLIWGQSFYCGVAPNPVITYMNPTPTDPNWPTNYYRYSTPAPATYQIDSIIENTNDPDYCDPSVTNCITAKGWPCQPNAGFNYCVRNP